MQPCWDHLFNSIAMKVISRKAHGFLDYIVSLFLIFSPWMIGFARGGNETTVPIVIAVLTLLYSLLTDYELGPGKVISFKTHLLLDTLSGITLAASPWLFGFAEFVYLPHLIMGLAEIAVVAMTSTKPSSSAIARQAI